MIEPISQWTGLWENIPSGPNRDFKALIKEFSTHEKVKMAFVCKVWFELINERDIAIDVLTKLEFKFNAEEFKYNPKESRLTQAVMKSWLSVCNENFKVPQTVIVLDVSGSMRKLKLLAQFEALSVVKTLPFIEKVGVDCIAFAGNSSRTKVYSAKDVSQFFYMDHNAKEDETNFDALFRKIFGIYDAYVKNYRTLPMEVHIVSDFDVPFDSQELFVERQASKINFTLHMIYDGSKLSDTPYHFMNTFMEYAKVNIEIEKRKTEIRQEPSGEAPKRRKLYRTRNS